MKALTAKIIIFFALLLAASTIKAQINADFSISVPQGCAPLKTSFNDQSTGISSSAIYLWDFGNGNSSSLKNPSAVFYAEGTYTVKLSVKDGNQTSVKTKTVTVFKKPPPDFTFSTVKGCSPLQVTFNSTSSPGDGSISSYFWDFGDGTTAQTSSLSYVHTYQQEQKATVSLTVTNQYGCVNTVTKANIIDVLPSLISDFSVDQTVLCRITDEVKFTNKSQGPGILSYLWDFGDGNTSTQKDPKHIYNQKGIYSIKLTVTSSEGCTSVKTLQNHVNVASYKSDFSTSSSEICTGNVISFTMLSNPVPTQTTWYMGDGTTHNYNFTFGHFYNIAGDYNVKLVNTFGNNCVDSVIKTIKVKQTPTVSNFIDTIVGNCGAPAQVKLRDTTAGAVAWEWWFNYGTNVSQFLGNTQSVTATVTSNGSPEVALIITNNQGCKAYYYRRLNIYAPNVNLIYTYSSAGGNYSEACDSVTMKFKAITQENIVSYKWYINTTVLSTDPEFQYTFMGQGNYGVRLEYVTDKGCTGTAYFTGIRVYEKKQNDFTSVSGTKICGNSIVNFRSTPADNNVNQYWYINGQYVGSSYYNSFQYQFQTAGKYTIMMLTYYGRCVDTVIKTDYIEVVPPFAKIDRFIPTCDGDRKTIRFLDGSRSVQSWSWNFGDGNTQTYTTPVTEIQHRYAASGYYKVVLSVSNGTCTVKDSTYVTVYAKQSPTLGTVNPSICPDQPLNITLSNIDPFPNSNGTFWNGTYLEKFEYNDGTPFRGTVDQIFFNSVMYPIPSTFTLRNFETGKTHLRIITRDGWYNCKDTSNYIPIQINGATAGFEIVTDNRCFQLPVVFRDTSKPSGNSSIASWEWNFGDGKIETYTQGGTVSHIYDNPGYYTVTLKVRDASGCVSSYSNFSRNVVVKGPKAAFSASSVNVPLNTVVYFFNNTNNSGASGAILYMWNFGNGVTSTDAYPFYQYTTAGVYTVTLTATDPVSGCASSASQVITVRNFNSAFNFNTSFVTTSPCPPVIARFTNTSAGYIRVSWDFGDGTTAGNVNYPSHIYTKPGKYIVKLLAYGYNGLQETYIDSVIVKGQQASFQFSPKETCTSSEVRFKASSTGVTNFLWDFGDGTFSASSSDSIAGFFYKSPGVYSPVLMGTNEDGCTVAYPSADKVIIDSLSAKITGIPAIACNQANIQFNADVYSVGAANNPGFLSYKWNFGTGNAADTSIAANPLFNYTAPGTYTVRLQVRARSGCFKEVTEKVVVQQSSKASINAIDSVCAGGSVLFKGNASIANGVQWNWNFKNGQQASVQNPPIQLFTQPGSFPVTLIVNNNGCLDTATHILTVSPPPVVQLSAASSKICLGTAVQLTANGGQTYQWSPSAGLNSASISSPLASPSATTKYKVTVLSKEGCTSVDSITIEVVQPFKINAQKVFSICEGETAQLSVTGASSYKWIGATQGLSSLTASTVTAKPANSITYTVVGFDNEGCFTDTAFINVTVNKRPFVNAGNDAEILPGTPYQIVTNSSTDVVQWLWSPAQFLSCTQCPSPVSTATRTMNYVVTVKNAQGCSASDTITLKTLCSGSQVFIPNSFTPNNDGLNDVFKVAGNGASFIKSFVIYDRWGNKVFEQKNIQTNHPSAGWNGYYKAVLSLPGTYTYFVQLVCDATGETFERKGSLLLLQ